MQLVHQNKVDKLLLIPLATRPPFWCEVKKGGQIAVDARLQLVHHFGVNKKKVDKLQPRRLQQEQQNN